MTEDRRQKTEHDGRWTSRLRSGVYRASLLVCIVLILLWAGCAATPRTSVESATPEVSPTADNPADAQADSELDMLEKDLEQRIVEVSDPLQPWNRLMFQVNDILYFWVVKPVAQTYKDITPEPARVGISNFFDNAGTPVRYVNCLLQGKGAGADTELRRFLINTSVGVLGFGDPALDQYGLKPVEEDLGQTLAAAGMNDGFYIVWPLFGPSTARDSLGMLGDQFLNPFWYVEPRELSIGISALKYTNSASFQIGRYEVFKAAAVDPYVAMRESYILYRDKKIQE